MLLTHAPSRRGLEDARGRLAVHSADQPRIENSARAANPTAEASRCAPTKAAAPRAPAVATLDGAADVAIPDSGSAVATCRSCRRITNY